jgi:hypothetical protein
VNERVKKMLNKLSIRCAFTSIGCPSVVALGEIEVHEDQCDFNPKQGEDTVCPKGCGKAMKGKDIDGHVCVAEDLLKINSELRRENTGVKIKLDQMMEERTSQIRSCFSTI